MNTPKTVPHTAAPWQYTKDGAITGPARTHDGEDPIHGTRSKAHCVANVHTSEYGDYHNYPREIAEANAAHIVLCVNNHDALMKLVKALAAELDCHKLSPRGQALYEAALAAAQPK